MTLWTLTFGCVVLYPYNFHEFSPSHCATVNSLTVVCIVWPGKRMVLANCVFFLERPGGILNCTMLWTLSQMFQQKFRCKERVSSHGKVWQSQVFRDFGALNFCENWETSSCQSRHVQTMGCSKLYFSSTKWRFHLYIWGVLGVTRSIFSEGKLESTLNMRVCMDGCLRWTTKENSCILVLIHINLDRCCSYGYGFNFRCHR